jgi:hypothetical protein
MKNKIVYPQKRKNKITSSYMCTVNYIQAVQVTRLVLIMVYGPDGTNVKPITKKIELEHPISDQATKLSL